MSAFLFHEMDFFKFIFIFFIYYVSVCLYALVCVQQCPWKPEERESELDLDLQLLKLKS